MRRAVLGPLVCSTLLLSACSGGPGAAPGPDASDPAGPASETPAAASPSAAAPSATTSSSDSPVPSSDRPAASPQETPDTWPELQVEVLAGDLELPWDVAQLSGGELLVTEKDRHRILLVDAAGEQRELSAGPQNAWSSGETGLMSLAVDPGDDDRFLTCTGYSDGQTTDVRVVEWTLDAERSSATEGDALITGIGTTSGRHGGCRIAISPGGDLFVGTGDAAVGTNPQDRTSLNGKVLRADATTGDPLPDNPFADAEDANEQLVYSYGHRNVQGLAFREDTLFAAEHGPAVDDEINIVQAGSNAGWNPVPAGGGDGYDESVPMTDPDLGEDVTGAIWSSGDPTLATSGLTVVQGAEWGNYAGSLAVAALKAQQLLFLPVDADGEVGEVRVPEPLTEHGRLRSVTQAEDGALLVTTSNGSGDELLRVTPVG